MEGILEVEKTFKLELSEPEMLMLNSMLQTYKKEVLNKLPSGNVAQEQLIVEIDELAYRKV
jgi:hypothetical protein